MDNSKRNVIMQNKIEDEIINEITSIKSQLDTIIECIVIFLDRIDICELSNSKFKAAQKLNKLHNDIELAKTKIK